MYFFSTFDNKKIFHPILIHLPKAKGFHDPHLSSQESTKGLWRAEWTENAWLAIQGEKYISFQFFKYQKLLNKLQKTDIIVKFVSSLWSWHVLCSMLLEFFLNRRVAFRDIARCLYFSSFTLLIWISDLKLYQSDYGEKQQQICRRLNHVSKLSATSAARPDRSLECQTMEY